MKVLEKAADNVNPALENVEDIYPLTPLQEGVIFHAIAEPSTVMHVGRTVCRLSGRLDIKAFRDAWNKLLARHSSLRTAFVWEGLEAPMQVVQKTLQMPFRHHDWTKFTANEAEEKFDEWLWQNAVVEFDLVHAPLGRVDVFSFTAEDHRFFWACHHVILDGWSIGIVLEELLTIVSGAEHTLPYAPRYRDHIAWILKRNAADDNQFWRRYLKGFTRRTSIHPPAPLDPAATSDYRRYTSHRIDAGSLSLITAAVKSSRVTLNTLLQAAWALVLSRYTASDDVVFGVVSSGRTDGVPGIERMVGLLMTTTPMRAKIVDGETVRLFLMRLQTDGTAIRQHEQAALTKIQNWSDMAPGEALFDSLYVFGNYPPPAQPPIAALSIESVDTNAPSNFPLAIVVEPDGKGEVVVTAVTDPTRFSNDVAERIVEAIITTALAMAENLDAPITAIDSMPAAERQKLDAWGYGGDLSLPCDDVVEMIEDIAKERPHAIAVTGNGEALTYEALLDHARSAASVLASLGVEPGEPVIVQIDRGPKAIVGILSILLAGGAYVPLDPTYPLARRTMVVKDSQARFMITDCDPADEFGDLTIVDLSEVEKGPRKTCTDQRVLPDTPAYIIYTSGSSGRPKGVVVSRSNLAYTTTVRKAFYGEPPKAFLLLSSLAFDSSVAGLFWALSTGGTLVIAEHRLEQDVERLAARVAEHNVTHLLCLPSLYAILIEHANPQKLSSLTHAIVAGEACPSSLPARHRLALPAAKLINEYGPTEASVWCVAADISGCPPDRSPPIGRPIPGTVIRLVDHRNRPAPRDTVGELIIGGPGVAAGYRDQGDMTAASFVQLPFDGGTRFYKTGDYARWRADGTLDFLGRRDEQLKIRGHRIEISEIEAALESVPEVETGVVTVLEDGFGTHLSAFVEGRNVDIAAVRSDLERRLPEAMVPRMISTIELLPRLPNGKVDRGQLMQLAETEITLHQEQSYRPATAPLEQTMVEIWKNVLKIDRVGIRDDFFTLGGDSLTSIRIVSLAKRHGLTIKPTSVLEYPTIEALARSMDHTDEAIETTTARPFFMIHGGERMRDYLRDALGERYAVHLFQDHWDDGYLPPTTSVKGMADQYLAELQTISPHGPYLIGGYSIGAAVSVVIAQRLIAEGEEVDMVFLLDPFDRYDDSGSMQGVDPEALNSMSATKPLRNNQSALSRSPKYHPPNGIADMPNFLAKRYQHTVAKYLRYLLGPSLLLRGTVAYYLDRPLSPKIAGKYAKIVYAIAGWHHKLTPYPGRLLVFRSMLENNPRQGSLWPELASGEYEEEHFHCEHLAFRRNPEVVKAWTQRLAERVRQVT